MEASVGPRYFSSLYAGTTKEITTRILRGCQMVLHDGFEVIVGPEAHGERAVGAETHGPSLHDALDARVRDELHAIDRLAPGHAPHGIDHLANRKRDARQIHDARRGPRRRRQVVRVKESLDDAPR